MVDELFSPEEQRTFQILDKWKVKSLEGFEKLGEIGLIDSSSILNLLTDLSSGEFNYKVELVTPKASKEDLIINIGSKFPENLAKLKKTYEDGISMGIRYWLWIVLYPLDHTLLTKGYQYSREAQECEILLKPAKGKNYHRAFYSHEDPRENHEYIFEKKKDKKLKPECNYFASVFAKYLIDMK